MSMKKKQSKLNLRLKQAFYASLWILMGLIFLLVGTTILQHLGEGGISCGDVPVGSDLQYFADHATYDYSQLFRTDPKSKILDRCINCADCLHTMHIKEPSDGTIRCKNCGIIIKILKYKGRWA